MKRVLIVLLFFILASGVLAMDEPVTVKTTPGDWVKIYAWPAGTGSLLALGDGIADAEGIFSYTFFSLNVPDVKFRVFIIRDNEKIIEKDFLGHDISKELNIECNGLTCIVIPEEIEEVVENETVEVANETIFEVVENETVEVGGLTRIYLTGKAIFSNEDGSFDLGNSAWAVMMILLVSVFVFMVFRRVKVEGESIEDEDEKELKYMEKKVKETAEKIKSVKEKKDRKQKIEAAKNKLAEEERELKNLQEEGGSKIENKEGNTEDTEKKVERSETNIQDLS